MNSKKIALIATLAAVSLAVTVLAAFLPSKIAPLALAALCYLLAFSLVGWAGGVLCGGVVIVLTFVTTGLSSSFFLTVLLFFPYAIIAYLLRKVKYAKKTIAIRILIVYVCFFAMSYALLRLGSALAGSSLAFLEESVGIWVASAVFALFCMPADFLLVSMADLIQRRVGTRRENRKRSREQEEREDIYAQYRENEDGGNENREESGFEDEKG